MEHTNHSDILTAVSSEFIKSSNKILDLFKKYPATVVLKEKFSLVLMRVYPNFMNDHLPSAQLLVDNQRFISFSALCRSTLDIIIQLTWLLSLDNIKKEKAINCFLEFEGVCLTSKGRQHYEWQYLIDKKYSSREAAIAVGIDKEILNLPMSKVFRESIENELVVEVNGKQLKLTVFDYLSKVTHWNPRLLNDLVGVNQNQHIGYTDEYLRLCVIALPTFISCAVIFGQLFFGHFFDDGDNQIKKLQVIKVDFEKAFAELINHAQTNVVVAE